MMARDSLDRIWGFLPPEAQRRIADEEKRYFERQLAPRAVPWDEDKTKFANDLCILGETFQPTRLFPSKPAHPTDRDRVKHERHSPGGEFSYLNMLLPRGIHLELWQGKRRGRVWFTTDVVIPALHYGPTTPRYNQPWMSYTPAEILSMRQGVRLATGKVLIGGLGMGYLLRKVASKPSVKGIVLVEISRELLDWYGRKMVENVREATGKPITVICDDVKDHIGKHGADTRHLIDIWDGFPAYVSREWEALADTVKYFWGWGWIRDREGCL